MQCIAIYWVNTCKELWHTNQHISVSLFLQTSPLWLRYRTDWSVLGIGFGVTRVSVVDTVEWVSLWADWWSTVAIVALISQCFSSECFSTAISLVRRAQVIQRLVLWVNRYLKCYTSDKCSNRLSFDMLSAETHHTWMNCRYSKLTPLLTTDSSVENVGTVGQTSGTDFYDRNLMNDNIDLTEPEDHSDLSNEKLLLQTDLYSANNYFGTNQHRLSGMSSHRASARLTCPTCLATLSVSMFISM